MSERIHAFGENGELSDGASLALQQFMTGTVNPAISAAVSGGGTTDHAALTNRDAAGQHPIGAITGLQTALDGKAVNGHTHTAAEISDATTTGRAVMQASSATAARTAIGAGTSNLQLGTGPTTAAAGDHGHTLNAVTDTASRVAMTPAERTKLSGIASGATVNVTDAQLRDRATHTGTQEISTVTGLQTALDGKQAAGSYASATHTHDGDYLPAAAVSADAGNTATLGTDSLIYVPPGEGGGGFPYPAITSGNGNWWTGPMMSTLTSGAGWGGPLGQVWYQPLPVGRAFRITDFQVSVATVGVNSVMHLGVYRPFDGFYDPLFGHSELIATFGQIPMDTEGTKQISGLAVDLQPGIYWLAALQVGDTAGSLRRAAEESWNYHFMVRRQDGRGGPLGGETNRTTLPSITGNSDSWNQSQAGWYSMKTAYIP